jgi:hypothetical protein
MYLSQSLPYLGRIQPLVLSSDAMILLSLTVLVITSLAVNEKGSEVNDVEVCDRSVESGWERPGEGHEEITPAKGSSQPDNTKITQKHIHVVRMTGDTPPSRDEKLGATLSLEISQVYSTHQ